MISGTTEEGRLPPAGIVWQRSRSEGKAVFLYGPKDVGRVSQSERLVMAVGSGTPAFGPERGIKRASIAQRLTSVLGRG